MYTRSKALLATLVAALLLAAAVNTAAANHLSMNEQGFRITYSPLSFIPSFGFAMTCPVTLEGTFHSRTIAKVQGALVGYVNRASAGACESGRMRMNTETLPWHLQYAGFEGTLPSITGIKQTLIGLSFSFDGEIFGIQGVCRYTAASELLIDTREFRGVITSQRPGEARILSETAGCPEFRLQGTGSVKTPTGGTILVSLI